MASVKGLRRQYVYCHGTYNHKWFWMVMNLDRTAYQPFANGTMRSATEVTRIVLCATGLVMDLPCSESLCNTIDRQPRGLQKAAEGFDAKDAKFPMPMRFPHTMLSTLTEWSAKHTEAIFAAKTVDECLIAIDQTFAIDVSGTGNGKSLTREDISKSVLSLRERSETGLKVRWRESVEIPSDAENTVS